jgi:hypothetical protein
LERVISVLLSNSRSIYVRGQGARRANGCHAQWKSGMAQNDGRFPRALGWRTAAHQQAS